MAKKISLYDLGLEIADEGGWEEFHQRRHNYTMYDHHKAQRLMLQRQYRERRAKGETLDACCHC